ncbi:MAG: antibiotic biosynthesis monooxygenase [Patescibacteria group bacterium]|nr:antibiotic biosynthesis monooxygenase [Patescibacteria group bacterium]
MPVSLEEKSSEQPKFQPATVVYSWKVLPGKEAAFMNWFHGITKAATRWPGHLGVTTLRPPEGQGTYHSILRFDTEQHLTDWLNSDERKQWLNQLEGVAVAQASSKATGLENWFDLPGSSITPPPKWKMVVVTFVAVYPLSLLLGAFVAPRLMGVNIFVRSLLFPVVVPVVLTYFLMPFLTQRVFKSWLYKRP